VIQVEDSNIGIEQGTVERVFQDGTWLIKRVLSQRRGTRKRCRLGVRWRETGGKPDP
jgi:hypothetical protein